MKQRMKEFKVHGRKSLASCETLEGREKDGRQSCCHLGEHIYCHEQYVTRNMNVKGPFGKISEGIGEHIIGNWRRGDCCYEVVENLEVLYSTMEQKIEFLRTSGGYLPEEISKQMMGFVIWFLLVAYSKM